MQSKRCSLLYLILFVKKKKRITGKLPKPSRTSAANSSVSVFCNPAVFSFLLRHCDIVPEIILQCLFQRGDQFAPRRDTDVVTETVLAHIE